MFRLARTAVGIAARRVASRSLTTGFSRPASGRTKALRVTAFVLGFAGISTAATLADDEARAERRVHAGKPLKVIIAGAPGSGKGTQSELIVKDYGLVHISTGDLLRDEVKAKSPAGLKAKTYMDAGQLVPQEVFFDILRGRLDRQDCRERGWLLDGYPRNRDQVALMTRHGYVPDGLIFLHITDAAAIARMCGRRTDPVTGKIYHMVFSPPPNDPVIRARLEQRSDDNEEKAATRLAVFHKNMDDAVNWYAASKTFIVNADDSVKNVYAGVVKALASMA